ncbi:MAG TPA: hypothetical protein VJR89_03935 [Polyangiales bacterium]|nr:hypothetical protein [Polyangiales bacterium]
MLERYRELLRDESLRTWSQEIERAALRDEVKWRETFRTFWSDCNEFNTHPEEIAYIREWLQTRWRVYSQQLGVQ